MRRVFAVSTIERDGVKLGYEESGSGDPPLLLVHGWSGPSTRRLAARLEERSGARLHPRPTAASVRVLPIPGSPNNIISHEHDTLRTTRPMLHLKGLEAVYPELFPGA